ncbi:transferrin-binding protein-like solute binding protein [Roseobacter sp. CCS2]|uniref:transferrin-binding protein-like solute binding protein n=1 Tax=Roseobacter sp. CCS2 TaxID=391593 RepID=UPI0000F3E55F|nr:transferrin-binding protein-like solute binding protein [Roseobacter sp. CCS2]EBA12008.1 hypothetical protein RCCS2_11964 [Roseobacter sp. CCS2]
MQATFLRGLCATIITSGLVACGGGGGGGGNTASDGTRPDDPAANFPGSVSAELDDTSALGEAGMAYVLLDGQILRESDRVSIRYSDGLVSGGLVREQSISDTDAFINPANGEFSRIVRISSDNLFGVVGLDIQDGDLPTSGNTNYNQGWVGMTAIFEDDVLVLEGDATFTVAWSGTGDIDGSFRNLSGTDSDDANVSNVGTIVLNNGIISGDNFDFAGSTVSGTGVFASLGGSGTSSSTTGTFFGPQANELGGVILIDDLPNDIQVSGAFQADSN